MNTLTRTPARCRSRMMVCNCDTGVLAGQPAWLVTSPARTGHERALVGPDLVHERQQIRPRIALDVELDPWVIVLQLGRRSRARRRA